MLTAVCTPVTFGNLSFFGAEVLSLEANLVSNYSVSVPTTYRFTQPAIEVVNAVFCNVTVTYTHPGQGDNVAVEAWLPPDGWNGRLQAVGGGGWVAGRSIFDIAMGGALGDGYAAISTDAGLRNAEDPSTWALLSPGNVNLYNLQNLASVSLNDTAVIGKALVKSYYGRGPDYTYWNGCSQGGRQGLMLAQRYPTAFDGIAAGAPAIYWTEIFPSMLWPQQTMNMLGEYPYPCEIQAITAAAVSACDGLDGITDGIISKTNDCLASFDPFDLVGQQINCTQAPTIGSAAAAVVNATWQGRHDAQGVQRWFGLNPGTDLSIGVAMTNCTGETCQGVPLSIATEWISLFVARGGGINISNLSHIEFDSLAPQSRQWYNSVIDTDDADLSAFQNAGGKLITFHGLVDETIPSRSTSKYYNEVSALIPSINDFYRHFEVPGMGHCAGRQSGEPTSLFDQLRAWVENGTAPDHSSIKVTGLDGAEQSRILCPYPQDVVFDQDCGAEGEARCWSCSESTP
ncbi:tannase and feruloyl esterase [Colletotrichum graminicola]|uniref:Carboxylic ester hydrolase n=1 Tax=Colletotrichum graminicola (strain M1.001 / M2 / FGSC 10212) TaxID=645133 RepID=E3QPU6_COLGM|nr:tannase and feruloyl esterase [Colletotrichum graminicola M1.001]EFQ32873.1 tannase and feruloyl esterase [Colletotrichum graminicola M1.001]WDK16521.1 tannase and feruloyl esterase [Colletotrichum graminicola]